MERWNQWSERGWSWEGSSLSFSCLTSQPLWPILIWPICSLTEMPETSSLEGRSFTLCTWVCDDVFSSWGCDALYVVCIHAKCRNVCVCGCLLLACHPSQAAGDTLFVTGGCTPARKHTENGSTRTVDQLLHAKLFSIERGLCVWVCRPRTYNHIIATLIHSMAALTPHVKTAFHIPTLCTRAAHCNLSGTLFLMLFKI